jgi:hypothetical protein
MNSTLNKTPTGYLIVINGEVVKDAGVNGVIKSLAVASRLRASLSAKYPDKDVSLFGCWMVKP